MVYAPVPSKQEPKFNIKRRLLNYRNTYRPSTEKTPAELMTKRRRMKPTEERVNIEAKAMDKEKRRYLSFI